MLGRWYVLLWQGRSLAKEELFHLLHDRFLVFAAGWVQAIFVQQHLAELDPLVPRLLRDVLINPFPEFGVKGRLVQAGQIFFQLGTENSVFRHGFLGTSKEN